MLRLEERVQPAASDTRCLVCETRIAEVEERDLLSEVLSDEVTRRKLIRDTLDIIPSEPLSRELEEMAALYGADEMMVLTITGDYASRLRSYELLIEAMN